MGWLRRALGAVAVVGLVLAGGPGADARPPWPAHADADLGALPASAETRDLVAWILATVQFAAAQVITAAAWNPP